MPSTRRARRRADLLGACTPVVERCRLFQQLPRHLVRSEVERRVSVGKHADSRDQLGARGGSNRLELGRSHAPCGASDDGGGYAPSTDVDAHIDECLPESRPCRRAALPCRSGIPHAPRPIAPLIPPRLRRPLVQAFSFAAMSLGDRDRELSLCVRAREGLQGCARLLERVRVLDRDA